MTTPAPAIAQRARPSMTVFGIAIVALLAYFDWLTHRQVALEIVGFLAVSAIILFRDKIVDASNLAPMLAQIPPRLRPALAAIPSLAYFLTRGQGTSNAGGVVILSVLILLGVSTFLGPEIDRVLGGFYAARNKILPLPVRLTLAFLLPILVGFLIIHGSLADLPAMFGGETNSPMSPAGAGGRFFFGTMLAGVVASLLMRDSPKAGP